MSEMGRGSDGAIARALLWVVLGLFGAVAAFVAVSPELAGNEPGLLLDLVGLVSLAAIPGVILLVLAAIRRKRLGLDDPDRDEQDRTALDRSLRANEGHDGDTDGGR